MRRIDRVNLHGEVGGTLQGGIALQRGDDFVGRADMHVHGGDQVAHQVARGEVAGGGQPMAHARQADLGKPHRLVVVVGDEDRARGEDARFAALGQGLEIGIEHRVLDIGQGGLRRFRRPWLGPRQHQPVACSAGTSCPGDGKRGLPDAVDQAGARRIELVAAVEFAS